MNVLSIRGGGIRGIIPALILARLEAETGKSCRELFGLIVGTSTGGILALGLALGIRADQMARLYSVRGPLIFRRRWRSYFGVFGAKYDLANLREAVYGAFRDAPLFDCSPVMVTATEVCTRKSVFLKSWRTEHMAIRCVDAGCATGAAPTYFDPVEIAGVGL